MQLDVPLAPDEACRRLWSAERHAARIPFTRLNVAGRLDRAGTRFVARTGVGPLRVDDVMLITAVEPRADGGERVAVRKIGRVLRGDITAIVSARNGGSRLSWRQDLRVRGLPRMAQPTVDALARVAYARTLRRILAD